LHQMALSSIAALPSMDRSRTTLTLVIYVVIPFKIMEFILLIGVY